jgi:hypothetical protein
MSLGLIRSLHAIFRMLSENSAKAQWRSDPANFALSGAHYIFSSEEIEPVSLLVTSKGGPSWSGNMSSLAWWGAQVASEMKLVLSPDGAALHLKLDLQAAKVLRLHLTPQSAAYAIGVSKGFKDVEFS